MSFPPAPPISSPSASSTEPPLWAPYYGASIGVAFSRFWRKYATFSGRASRSEFWWWYLVYLVYIVIFEIVFFSVGAGGTVADPSSGTMSFTPAYFVLLGIAWVVSFGMLVATLAIMWRRLHDTDRSGRYFFLSLIPLVGGIILLVFLASRSNPAGARFDLPRA